MSLAPPTPAFSILVPNFNYARYIGETLRSVLADPGDDVEVAVADNASTDGSEEVVRGVADPRVRLAVNACNIGFAANLERVAAMARGRRMLLLSSDDRMRPEALPAYRRLGAALGDAADRVVWGAATTIIDSAGEVTGAVAPDPKLWRDAVVDATLSAAVGHPVRRIGAAQLLRRSLELLRSPLPFASTCYPRALHDAAGGYAGGRLINPDKWFLWKLMAVADEVCVVDHPLFDYRVHAAGQLSQEQRSGALKHLTDQYVSTFSLPDEVLAAAGMTKDEVARAFIEQDIALRGLAAVAEGKLVTARRAVHFALATYPDLTRRNVKVWALRALLGAGPLAPRIAAAVRARVEARWRERESRRA